MGASLGELDRVEKQIAVRKLDEQGAFLLRKSIEYVADVMGVSRITIYNYLNAIRE
jgi:predicted transcriptional regulator YheO